MRFIRRKDILAGYWVLGPHPDLPEFIQLGEHWIPEDWQVGSHQHQGWELYYQAAGSSQWRHPQGVSQVKAGQAYFVGPDIVHESIRFARGKQHFFFLEYDLRPWWSLTPSPPGQPMFHVLSNAQSLEPLFRLLIQEGAHSGASQPVALRHLFGLLTLQVERLLGAQSDTKSAPSPIDISPSLYRAKELLESNPEHPWKLDELGKLTGLSPNYLSTQFRLAFGQPPLRYLQQIRIERAQQLLCHTGMSMTQIAGELSFSSSQHFSTVFKQLTGETPRQFQTKAGAVSSATTKKER